MKKVLLFIFLSVAVGCTFFALYIALVGPGPSQTTVPGSNQVEFSPNQDTKPVKINPTRIGSDFILPSDIERVPPKMVADALYDQGFIRNRFSYWLFRGLALFKGKIETGGYKLTGDMNVFQIYQNLANPYMRYVHISEGLRREEVASQFAKVLRWDTKTTETFLSQAEFIDKDIKEGFFFPASYLVPTNSDAAEVHALISKKFSENVIALYESKKNNVVSLDTILIIASLIQREAAGKYDMGIISGIVWNRLFNDWYLQVDAAIQYAKGTPQKWWPRVTLADYRNVDSPYNTYLYKGLPPGPIANPGLAAIKAAMNPAETSCMFYVHGPNREFLCSKTYAGHEQNIGRLYPNYARN